MWSGPRLHFRTLLFLININDLEKYIVECTANLYADDTTLITSNRNKKTLYVNAVHKTEVIIFGTKRKLANIGRSLILINEEKIKR